MMSEGNGMSAQTEQEMQASVVPEIKSMDELVSYIGALVEREHDYGTCVYAMSMAAVAAFNYVAGSLGVTGFQASCADLDIIRRTRRINGPFAIVDSQNMLYPQYNIQEDVERLLKEWSAWAAIEATKKLKEHSADAHPNVVAHWEKLVAAGEPI